MRRRFAKRPQGIDGEAVGNAHANPFFDTRDYDIDFMDGSVDKYTANAISEKMFAQVDDKGNQYLLMKNITDHSKDNTAIPISDGMTHVHNGNKSPKITTRGWELLLE